MVDARREVDLGGLERVVGRELDVEEVHTAGEGRVIRAHNGRLQVILVLLVDGASRAVGRWVLTKVHELLLNAF